MVDNGNFKEVAAEINTAATTRLMLARIISKEGASSVQFSLVLRGTNSKRFSILARLAGEIKSETPLPTQVKSRTKPRESALGLNRSFVSYWFDKSSEVYTTPLAFEENHSVKIMTTPEPNKKSVGVGTLEANTFIW